MILNYENINSNNEEIVNIATVDNTILHKNSCYINNNINVPYNNDLPNNDVDVILNNNGHNNNNNNAKNNTWLISQLATWAIKENITLSALKKSASYNKKNTRM